MAIKPCNALHSTTGQNVISKLKIKYKVDKSIDVPNINHDFIAKIQQLFK
jgi:hypothetical protein